MAPQGERVGPGGEKAEFISRLEEEAAGPTFKTYLTNLLPFWRNDVLQLRTFARKYFPDLK